MKIVTQSVSILAFTFLCCLSAYAQGKSFTKGKVTSRNYFEEIQFEFQKNKIYIPVNINGITYRFLLDTGAPNIISKEVREAIQPKLLESIPTNDANKLRQTLDVVSVESIKIGNVNFENFAALVYDLRASSVFKCLEIDGFIGSNMLRNSIIEIDAEQKVLKLTDDPKRLGLRKKDAEKMKLVNNQGSPYVRINLIGQEKGNEMLLIDTGMGGLYDLSKQNYDIFKSHKIFNPIGVSDGASSVSLFGEVPVNSQTRLHLPKLVISDFEIDNVITHTTNDDNSRIGSEVLHHGIMTLDFKNKRFYFKPYSESVVMDGDFGFTQTLKNEKLVIGYVWDEDLKSKIKYGDEILEINGVEVDTTSLCDYVARKSILKTNNIVSLKVKNDKDEVLELNVVKKQLPTILNIFSAN